MPPQPNIRQLYDRWQMAKHTHDEAVARNLSAPVQAFTLARENNTWQDYAQALAALA